ncbi:hypothetical protein C1H46_015167 [Malus baccata]|uniref:Uncharacterized protein n=1 Tax=Malus baccata TaxID=106549 RepID=A0A540MKE3_MALBA|nr:hypothetical protein C1H46_015167 [Malus baccata]
MGIKNPSVTEPIKSNRVKVMNVNIRARTLHISESTTTKHGEEKCMQIRIGVETMKVRAK